MIINKLVLIIILKAACDRINSSEVVVTMVLASFLFALNISFLPMMCYKRQTRCARNAYMLLDANLDSHKVLP
jgi:hypothetical protein